MQKGKFGFSLWLYPFISLWLMLFNQTLANVLILGFVIAVEKDEWAVKQCAHVLMFSIYWAMYNFIMDMITGWFESVPLIGGVAAAPLNILDTVVWIVLVILCFALGLSRLKHGEDIGLPGKNVINRAYGYAHRRWDDRNQDYGRQYDQPPHGDYAYEQRPGYHERQYPREPERGQQYRQYEPAPPPPPPPMR